MCKNNKYISPVFQSSPVFVPFHSLGGLQREGTNTELEYWTDIFLAFTHVVVG